MYIKHIYTLRAKPQVLKTSTFFHAPFSGNIELSWKLIAPIFFFVLLCLDSLTERSVLTPARRFLLLKPSRAIGMLTWPLVFSCDVRLFVEGGWVLWCSFLCSNIGLKYYNSGKNIFLVKKFLYPRNLHNLCEFVSHLADIFQTIASNSWNLSSVTRDCWWGSSLSQTA